MIQCIGECREWLPLEAFYNISKSKCCKECSRARARRKYHTCSETRNGIKLRNRVKLLHAYGLTWEQFAAMWDAQGGCCAICRRPVNAFSPNNVADAACVDHCHITGKVRGILCRSCNLALGYFKDDTVTLASAINYIRSSHGADAPAANPNPAG